jgi:hypothetical protein
LGLRCDYKRPMWWSNNDQRRMQKDQIKLIIKRKKLTEKTTAQVMTPGSDATPGLSHSLPTSATFSESIDRTRSGSVDSQFSMDFDFNAGPGILDYTAYNAQLGLAHPQFAPPLYADYAPYDIDVKTERQTFVDDSLTRRESTTSTYSTYHMPPPDACLPSFPASGGEYMEELFAEPFDMNLFDSVNGLPTTPCQPVIELDERDQVLYHHFIDNVLPSIFPILDTNQQMRSEIVLTGLATNKSYLHCCLSISAQHYKATMAGAQNAEIDQDILRHRYQTISDLCEALKRDEDHAQILEATLGMIFFQTSVGRPDDSLPDISWYQHFEAAISLVQKLDLPRLVTATAEQQPTPFNMALTAWIDILGATIRNRAPAFAHTYREKHLSSSNCSLGLRELIGCEDRVMYLISEIACLSALKEGGMDDIQLCQHVHSLGDQIGLTELHDSAPRIPYNANGSLNARQLSKNITAAFRLAARIYLCSLVPGFSPSGDSCVGLVAKLAQVLEFIPLGPNGYDRSLIWVYLIGGSASTPGSSFRSLFAARCDALGEASDTGSFGKMATVLKEAWGTESGQTTPGGSLQEAPYVPWRNVMQNKNWDFLLI